MDRSPRRARPRRLTTMLVGLLVVALPGVVATACNPTPTIAYPNVQVLVPTNAISITKPTPSTRLLAFTHITWNAGAGPLDIRPSLDPATGYATATQGLYTLTGSSTWSYVRSVPIVKPMLFVPPSDYRFPMTSFGLYNSTSGGTLGSLVTAGPKVDFCMTPDTFVGGVANTAPAASPPSSNCSDPNAPLGLSVGWGDQYDSSDAGEDIDISNLPDGTYWLRAQADPGNFFTQGGTNQSVTDTQLAISGSTVTVLQQVHPVVTVPVVAITSPGGGAVVAGATNFTASVTSSTAIASVQFLLDGFPYGAPVTTAPYTLHVASPPKGAHQLSAQATDVNGFVGTAPPVSFSVASKVGSITIDQVVTATGNGTVTTPGFNTPATGETVLAFVGADGLSGSTQTATVSGGGLTWTPVTRADAQPGDAEIWSAPAPARLSGAKVTATAGVSGKSVFLTVMTLQGGVGLGASRAASATTGAPSIGLTAQGTGSVAFAVGNDWDHAVDRTPAAGQTLSSQWLDTAAGDAYWTQYTSAPGPAAGQTITLADTAPVNDRWNLAAVEVLTSTPAPAAADPSAPPPTAAPTVADPTTTAAGNPTPPPGSVGPAATSAPVITSPTAGEKVSGTIPVTVSVPGSASSGSVQLFLDGLSLGTVLKPPAYRLTWDTTTSLNGFHTLTAVATDGDAHQTTSTTTKVLVANTSVCFNNDVNVVAQGPGPVTTAPFTTAGNGELLLAFVGADGPASGGQTVAVEGAGLTWQLVRRSNGQPGDVEVWKAVAPTPLDGAQVTVTPSRPGYDAFVDLVAIEGTSGVGASADGGGSSGAAQVSLTTTQPQSLVYGIGGDWDTPTAHVAGANQVVGQQWLDTGAGAAYWVQNTITQTGPAGTAVTLDDTAPTSDGWNLVTVEVLAANNPNYVTP